MIITYRDLNKLIFDWNLADEMPIVLSKKPQFLDETLRDGLQAASIQYPVLEEKIHLLLLMEKIGIHSVNLGMAFASQKFKEDVEGLLIAVRENNLKILPNCPARLISDDINIYLDIISRTEVPLEICVFIASSPIRVLVEGWYLDKIIEDIERTITEAVNNSLSVMFVTEDTVRAAPETLKALFISAISCGAKRIAICDTVGHATPNGTRKIINFTKKILSDLGENKVGIDWHGHRDRGLALANALAAIEAGASRIHATAYGIGERSGNIPMELLLMNCKLLGWIENDLYHLTEYSNYVSQITGLSIPVHMPVVGTNAFRTQTGIHASALIKAKRIGDTWLEDRVYSSVPAEWVGRKQEIEIGPNSGRSNVIWWLVHHAISYNSELVMKILAEAKKQQHILADREIFKIIEKHGPLPEVPER